MSMVLKIVKCHYSSLRFHHLIVPVVLSMSVCCCVVSAGSIVRALELGADIVLTGRCADSSLALAPAAHHVSTEFKTYYHLLP